MDWLRRLTGDSESELLARRGLDGLMLTNTVTMLIRKGLQVGYKTVGEDPTPHPYPFNGNESGNG